jgi:hypothetical protein
VILALAAATDWRWLYWVPAGWGVLLLVHYLVYKAGTSDQRWFDERTDQSRTKRDAPGPVEGIRSEQGGDDAPDGKARDHRLP